MKAYALILMLIIGVVVYPSMLYQSVETVTVTVEEKERITTGSSKNLSHKYLVFTDSEVFENTDNFFFFKFGSSDLQRDLKEGQSYQVKVAGWRNKVLSWYRNIIEIRG